MQNYIESYNFTLDEWQLNAAQKIIEEGQNVLVTAHTGSGKTVVAEAGIYDALQNGKKVLYTSPIKSLSNQKFNEFKKRYPDVTVGIVTGDIKYNPHSQIVILTTEILRNLLYQIDHDDIDIHKDVSVVIFDEVHYISDKNRGKIWEECFILLPNHIKLVMLSATIDNPLSFCEWLNSIKTKTTYLFQTNKRVVPLKHYVYLIGQNKKKGEKGCIINKYHNQLSILMDDDKIFSDKTYRDVRNIKRNYLKYTGKKRVNRQGIINQSVNFLQSNDMFPAIYFIFSRVKCDKYASAIGKILNSSLEQVEVEKLVNHYLSKLENNYEHLAQFQMYKSMWVRGIAVHHSGLIPVLKEIIELLFSRMLIKVLFATETFAVGINMPAKVVLFAGLTKHDDSGVRDLKTHEYLQMSGRAGRRGIDTVGNVILLVNLFDIPDYHTFRNMLNGRTQKIKSKFDLNFQLILKIILSGNKNIINILSKSLLKKEFIDSIKKTEIRLEELYVMLPPDYDHLILEILKIDEQLNDTNIKYSKQYRKTMMENMKELMEKLPKGVQDIYLTQKDKVIEKFTLLDDLGYYHDSISFELRKVLSYLKKYDYITTDALDEISPEIVTMKGIIASHVSECNEILFTEMLFNGDFDNLSTIEIAVLLTIFIETKILDSKKQNNYNSSKFTTKFTTKFYALVDGIYQFSIEAAGELGKLSIYIPYNWEVSDGLFDIAYDWLTGKSINSITLPYFEGNFISDMIKITTIARNLEKLAVLLKKPKLAQQASEIEKLIMRDIVSVESLYVK